MARVLTGVVSSDKRDKTITVEITSREAHPIYKKQYSKTRKYTAHDEKNAAHEGDIVTIAESKTHSKTKTWELVKIVEKFHGKVELKEGVTEVESDEKEEK